MANKYVQAFTKSVLGKVTSSLGDDSAKFVYNKLAARFGATPIIVRGQNGIFEGSPLDSVIQAYARRSEYDSEVIGLLKSLVASGPADTTFLDIGANIGLISIPVIKETGVNAHLFEASPINAEFLVRNVAHNQVGDLVQVHTCALGAAAETGELQLSDGNFGGNALRRADRLTKKEKYNESSLPTAQVDIRPLDEVVRDTVRPESAVIKMDVEGAEGLIFQGGRNVLGNARFIVSEFSPYGLHRCGTSVEVFLELVDCFELGAIISDSGDQSARVSSATLMKTPELKQEMARRVSFDGTGARFIDIVLCRTPDDFNTAA